MKKILSLLCLFAIIAEPVFGQSRPAPPKPPEPAIPARGDNSYHDQQRKARQAAERGWWIDPFAPWPGPSVLITQEARTFLVRYTRPGPRAEYPRAELLKIYEAVRDQYRETEAGPVSRWTETDIEQVVIREQEPRDLLYKSIATGAVAKFPPLQEVDGTEISRERFVEFLRDGYVFQVALQSTRPCEPCLGRGQVLGQDGNQVAALIDCPDCEGSSEQPHLIRYTVRWQ